MDVKKIVRGLSLSNAVLVVWVSVSGLLIPGFYSSETINWQAQAIGQDAIDLFLISPVLIITTILAARKNNIAFLLWGGVNLYIIYTYIIYCFDIHFNSLFIIYCLVLGLSFYSFMYFLFSQIKKPITNEIFHRPVVKIIEVYFLIISCLFCFLWLSEIVPAIIHYRIPKSVIESGLFTNPVQVIDLSIVLPGFFLTSIFLTKKKPLALLFVPCILVFCVLMDITIGWLIIVMKSKGVEASYFITIIMGVLSLISVILLIFYLRSLRDSLKQREIKQENISYFSISNDFPVKNSDFPQNGELRH